jgi:hypothetical protein
MEPINASWVAARGSTVAEAAIVGISVGEAVGDEVDVDATFVAEGTDVGGGSVGIGVCVPGKACETAPQASDSRTIDNGKNLRTFNITISFPSHDASHMVCWQLD